MKENWVSGDVLANGIRLHYYRTGHGDKPPLVLAHGITDNGLCWTPVAEVLEQWYDVVMYDARGHGLSEAPEHDYGAQTLAADLAGLVKALNIAPVRAMGHSMGAATVAEFVAGYPDLAVCAVLDDPPWRDNFLATPEQRQETAENFRQMILAMRQATPEELLARNRQESPSWSEAERGPWVTSKLQVKPQVVEFVLNPGTPWRELLPRIACPTLLITGDPALGAIVTPEVAAEALRLLPNGRHVHIPGVGHNTRREGFEAYIKAVTEFLASVG